MNTTPSDQPEENQPDDSLNSVLLNLQPDVREKILQIARLHGLPDQDPLWAVVQAIREGDAKYAAAVCEIKTILSDFQESMKQTSALFQDAASEQAKVLTEVKELILETQNHQAAAASKLITSEEYCEKTSRWALGLATAALLFGLYTAVLGVGMVSTLGAIQTERQNLVVEIKHVSELQKLAGYRTQLTNERAELEANWKQLQKLIAEQEMTPQLQSLKTELETTHANIVRKQHELLTLEKKTYEN